MNDEKIFIAFVLTAVFSFLVGLEIKTYKKENHSSKEGNYFFGTTRTFTFVGILGFVMYIMDREEFIPYTALLLSISGIYAVFYMKKLEEGRHSVLPYLVSILVYAFGPLSLEFSYWLPALLFVTLIFILNAKPLIERMTVGLDSYEIETFGKMILLSAVILPLLPNREIVPYIPLSPFKIWLAVVVISAISYGGYIAQKYIFPDKGYFVTGIIGGTYSSTATTVVLARKGGREGKNPIVEAAMIAATSMMYIRLIVVAAVFNMDVAYSLAIPFILLAAGSFAVSALLMAGERKEGKKSDFVDDNPLELGTAFLFAILFVAMMVLTRYVTQEYGGAGLQILSFVVGFTDIDPFVLSLLTGKYMVSHAEIVSSVMIAAGSNNLLKAIYAVWFGKFADTYRAASVIALLGVVTIVWAVKL